MIAHRARALLATAAALMLAGCVRTSFENAPAAAAACDPALVGHWSSIGEKPDDDGELQAIIDRDCALVTIERRAEGERRSGPTQLRNAQVSGTRYLWLDATWVHQAFGIDVASIDKPGDIYLFAWRLRRGQLQLDAPSHRALAKQVVGRRIDGDLLQQDESLAVRIRGDVAAIRRVLARHRPFRFDDPIAFRRIDAGAAE